MTDKLKLFKVRLASGAERFVVGPTGADVWGLKFSTAQSPEQTGPDDDIVSVESIVPVDFVMHGEDALRKILGLVVPTRQTEKCQGCGAVTDVSPETVYNQNGSLHSCPDPSWRQAEVPEATDQAKPPRDGALCPQCGNPLHAWSHEPLGHQVGPVLEGTFHNHAPDAEWEWCKLCREERAKRSSAGA